MLKRYRKIKKTSLHSMISFHILTSKYKNAKAFKRFCGNNIDFFNEIAYTKYTDRNICRAVRLSSQNNRLKAVRPSN